jgi:hypothetical protein
VPWRPLHSGVRQTRLAIRYQLFEAGSVPSPAPASLRKNRQSLIVSH